MSRDLMVSVKLKYVYSDVDRHGVTRFYFKRGRGFKKIRIRGVPSSPEFLIQYQALLGQVEAGAIKPVVPRKPNPLTPTSRTLGWLVVQHQASAEWSDYDEATKKQRRSTYQRMLDEAIFPGAVEVFCEFPLDELKLKSLEALRDRVRTQPSVANSRVKALRALTKWGKRVGHLTADPALGLSKVRDVSEGWHTWTEAEVEQFEARHPGGSKARLALYLILYTGARRSDVIVLGRKHRRGMTLTWTAHKNRNRHPVQIEIPILPPLAEELERAPTGDLAFLATEKGPPFTHGGFGNWFKDRCVEAGLPHCSAHGLRKAGATRAAEASATSHELMSMFGWKSLAEAERYTRAASKKRLAESGFGKLIPIKRGT